MFVHVFEPRGLLQNGGFSLSGFPQKRRTQVVAEGSRNQIAEG